MIKNKEKTKSNLKEKLKENDKEKDVHYDIEDEENQHPHKLFEPLPFYDYNLFEEKIDESELKIHINPFAQKKVVFIPKNRIQIQITAERKSISHVINPYMYIINIEHNNYKWKVDKSYKEIKDVHKILNRIVKGELGIDPYHIPKEQLKADWPYFPITHDNMIPESKIHIRCKNLARYLERVLTFPPFRDHPAVHKLLGVSHLSFVPSLGPSLIEGMLLKKTGDTLLYGKCNKTKIVCNKLKFCHEKRWFCVKDTYIANLNPYYNNSNGFVMLVDSEFECKMKIKAGAYHAIVIKNLQKLLVLKFRNAHIQKEWYDKIMHMINTTGKCFKDSSYLRYDSYAPVRTNQLCRWYVNASTYMEHVMDALNNAKEEIYIADWWMCPELFLKRPTDDLQYRLDKILLKKAKEGVKVYILLYKEITFALNLMSLRTRQLLSEYGLNPNIKVLRHPDHFFDGVFLWSHHEKCVIIDQSIALMGGIDLCFGRWDDEAHRLTDLGRTQNLTEIDESKTEKLPSSQSESNVLLIKEIKPIKYINKNQYSQQQLSSLIKSNVKSSQSLKKQTETELKIINAFTASTKYSTIFKQQQKQQPLKRANKTVKFEIKTGNGSTSMLKSESKNSINSRKFLRADERNGFLSSRSSSKLNLSTKLAQNQRQVRWVTTKQEMLKNKRISLADIFRNRHQLGMQSNLDDDIYDRWHSNKVNTSFIDIEDIELPKNSDAGYYYWVGKDYSNTYREDFKDIHEYSKDQFDRQEVPRMPWRDEGMIVFGESARDLARHFIQRWNQCKNEQVPFVDSYPYLLPKCNTEQFSYTVREWFKDELFKCSVQMLRSVDDWSAGISRTETSILKAYCDLIKKAEHYIYIENQFFITTTDGNKDNQVKNEIGLAIAERIKQAHENKKKFKVYIFVPLLPGFDRINAIKAVQYYNLRSINIGEYSIYSYLKKAGVEDPSEYITFHGMRNWSVLMGKLVQEIIYVHSKLMIVDDKHVICGSANINDRSMLGKRDSEVAAFISDEEFVDSILNGQNVKAGKYALSLRQKIFKLHVGCYFNNENKINVTDCASDEFFNMFKTLSHQNSYVYDEVFKCLPSDNILNFNDLKNYGKQPSLYKNDPVEGKKKLEKFVTGLVVDFPLKFLSHEKNFFPDFDTPEGIVPTEIWT